MIEFIQDAFIPTAYVCICFMIVGFAWDMWDMFWRNYSCERCDNLMDYISHLEQELSDVRGSVSTARRSGGDDESDHRHLPEPPAA
jgi:hypothetical protein